MIDIKELLKATAESAGFNLDIKNDGRCIECEELAAPKCPTDRGKREYEISGLCEECFNDFFSEE